MKGFERAALPTALVIGAVLAGPTNGQQVVADIALEGGQEVPPVVTTATGTASLSYDTGTGVVTITGTYTNLSSDQTAAHLHTGDFGSNGGAFLGLPATRGTTGTFAGAGGLAGPPLNRYFTGRLYINVHSVDNPAGEVRGQVVNLRCSAALPTDPALVDCAGDPMRGPRLNDATETFDVELDCSGAQAPGLYRIVVRLSTLQAPVTTGLGNLWFTGPRIFKAGGMHAQGTVKAVGGGGMLIPNDLTLVNLSYCVQGFCFDPANPIGRYSNALIEVVEG